MKKVAKLLALVVALCLLSSAALAQEIINTSGTYPIVNEPYKVSIGFVPMADGVEIDQYYFTAYFDHLSGLEIDWTCIDSSSAAERIPLMLSAGDMPDALLAGGFNIDKTLRYGMQEGVLRPVNDLLQYMPLFSAILEENPQVTKDITCLDGNIYGFPVLSSKDNQFNMRFWYNQKWLDNLGMEIPTTLDEFYNLLVAFRDQDADGDGDPSNEIPFSGAWDEGWQERAPIMTAMGFNSNGEYLGLNFLTERPTAAYFPYTGQYRSYIEFMKKLYDEKLLDPDMFTQSGIQYNAKLQEGIVGFGDGAADYVMNEDPEVYTGYIPMTSSVCDTPLYTKTGSSVGNMGMVINVDVSDETAVVLAKLGDAFYDPRTLIETILGVDAGSELDFFGWGNTYDAETNTLGKASKPEDVDDWTFICRYMGMMDVPGYMTQPENEIPYCQTYPDTALGRRFADNGGYQYEDWNLEFQEKCQKFENYVLPAMYMEPEDVERLAEMKTLLDDYAAKMEAQFITGAASLEDYDAYLAELEKLGVQEYVDIYAKYWDAYYESLNP